MFVDFVPDVEFKLRFLLSGRGGITSLGPGICSGCHVWCDGRYCDRHVNKIAKF